MRANRRFAGEVPAGGTEISGARVNNRVSRRIVIEGSSVNGKIGHAGRIGDGIGQTRDVEDIIPLVVVKVEAGLFFKANPAEFSARRANEQNGVQAKPVGRRATRSRIGGRRITVG